MASAAVEDDGILELLQWMLRLSIPPPQQQLCTASTYHALLHGVL